MVDRYRSFLDESKSSAYKNKKSSFLIESNINQYEKYIKEAERHTKGMQKCISEYRKALTAEEEHNIVEKYQKQQMYLKEKRDYLVKQYRSMQNSHQSDSQILYVKQYLLKTVQQELKLDVQLNQLVQNRKSERQKLCEKVVPGSEKLKNALDDIKQKRDQIIYLDECVKQCVNLLEIIGILVLQQGDKIKIAKQNVEKANQNIDRALVKIETAKIRQQKANNRKCCIIILGLIVIIAILASLGYISGWF